MPQVNPTTDHIAVSEKERHRYTGHIDAILAIADLETISRKKIREGLETAEGKDLDYQKVSPSFHAAISSC